MFSTLSLSKWGLKASLKSPTVVVGGTGTSNLWLFSSINARLVTVTSSIYYQPLSKSQIAQELILHMLGMWEETGAPKGKPQGCKQNFPRKEFRLNPTSGIQERTLWARTLVICCHCNPHSWVSLCTSFLFIPALYQPTWGYGSTGSPPCGPHTIAMPQHFCSHGLMPDLQSSLSSSFF